MLEDLTKLPLCQLRQMWAEAWEKEPHSRIGRTMLEKSLEFKLKEQRGNGFTADQKTRLAELIKKYKRDPSKLEASTSLKPGTRLVRLHEGKKHSVLIKSDGFEYDGKTYTSLSKIANNITGKNWNGWVFFGLKKAHKQ